MENVIDLKCSGCGGRIIHDPYNNVFKCISCDSKYTIDDIKVIDKDIDNKEVEKYKCSNCGAEITLDGLNVSTECDYCGNTAIVRSRLSNEYKPDSIIPFSVKDDIIMDEFRKIAKENNEITMHFVNTMKIEEVKPIYIPFFLYSFGISAKMNIMGSNGMHDGNARIDLDDVPIDGSVKLDDDSMMNLFPYDMSKMIDYNHAYLSGHQAEMYDDSKERVSKKVENKTIKTIRKHYDHKMVGAEIVHIYQTSKKIKYILLPVWMIDLSYKGKKYTFYMNGQTGKIVGKIKRFNFMPIVYSIIYFLGLYGTINYVSSLNIQDASKADNIFFKIVAIISVIYAFFMYISTKKLVKKCDSLDMFDDKAVVKEELYQ